MKALSAKTHRRLGALARYMSRYANNIEEHFNMCSWMSHDSGDMFEEEHDVSIGAVLSRKDLMTCGTTACALGWACQVPALKHTGLELIYNGHNAGSVRLRKSELTGVFDIAAKVFELSERQAEWLFTNVTDYETPAKWADRCREFLATNGKM